jgi:hypothetical protein
MININNPETNNTACGLYFFNKRLPVKAMKNKDSMAPKYSII